MPTPAEIFNNYLSVTPEEVQNRVRGLTEERINQSIESAVLRIFQAAAERVPAYKDFLKKNNVDSSKIKNLEDFQALPLTDKENYLSNYPLESLVLDGDLSKTTAITMSSGSTGEPFYWPRNLEQDLSIALGVEWAFIEQFQIHKKKSLLLTSLGMGVWMAGDIMSMSSRLLAQKGYPVTLMNPGVDLETNLKILKSIGSNFDQVIISCYPPLAKDIVDNAERFGLNWKNINIKFFVGGEPFVEEWRDYVLRKIKAKSFAEPIMACLGSSEGGVAGTETPICIVARQLCKEKDHLSKLIFNDERIPSIIQYNPLSKYFESVNDQLILSALNGLPLIRYNTKDAGEIVPFSRFMERLKKADAELDKKLLNIPHNFSCELPFLYLFGRSDLTATIYGVNVYPENIRGSLLHKNLQPLVTGKFYMKTNYDKEGNQFLSVTVELKEKIKSDYWTQRKIKTAIVHFLKDNNSEYRKLTQYIGRKADPDLSLVSYGSSIFKTSNKLKYVQ